MTTDAARTGTERVLVALSGGVDSAVAAALLVDAGHDVTGVHLRLADTDPQVLGQGCCGLDDAQDARRTAQVLGIPFHVWDLRDVFRREVREPFAADYAAGATPNPCVTCNERVKVGAVLRRATALGHDALATGHHARIEVGDDGRSVLRRAADRAKDQSYVLHVHGPDELARLRTPVGDLTKAEVRDLAAERGLRVATKPDSHDICFIPDGDTAGHLADELPAAPGEVVDLDGTVLGEHEGVWRFTVGQRRGLGLQHHEPRFVVDLDPDEQRVVVGPRAALATRWIEVGPVVWQAEAAQVAGQAVHVQVRAHGRPRRGRITPTGDGTARVEVDEPFHGVAVGQRCVVYDDRDDVVLAGGRITAAERPLLPTV